MSGEVMKVPSVLLTESAFKQAQDVGIVGIEPNRDHMLAIGMATETGNEYIPDITIMRAHAARRRDWDTNYNSVESDYRYYSSGDLGVTERDPQRVSAGGLRVHSNDAGKKILELTVKDWDGLGETFAEALFNLKGRKGKDATDIIMTPILKLGRFLGHTELETPRMFYMEQAKALNPYIIERRS